jgi:PPM family protein phosphatase
VQLDTASISHQGGRAENQDSLSELHMVGGKASCWVLADGLGGHEGGQIASSEAVQSILTDFMNEDPSTDTLRTVDWLGKAHVGLIAEQSKQERLSQMRTTAVVLAIKNGKAYWTHCGDSRLYWFRKGEIVIQSEDHSIPQALVKLGQILPDEIRFHEDRNRVTQCLGSPGGVQPSENSPFEICEGDAFLICSDGFWEYVFEPEMLIDLSKAKGAQHWLELMLRRCKARAPEGSDNYSAIAGIAGAENTDG